MSGAFRFEQDMIALPTGAWAGSHRRSLQWRGRDVLAITQGRFRSYVFPLYTPAGFAATTESPADHPHHNSVWVASDHVHALMDVGGGRNEEYTYNFYVNDVFQGRAPGRIVETAVAGRETGADRYRIEQTLRWTGPPEWAAGEGRAIAEETRIIDVRCSERSHVIDLRSLLSPTEWDLCLGPTRHAWFNIRVAESMRVERGGWLRDSDGREGAAAISAAGAEWVDFAGPVGGGHIAGVTLVAGPGIAERSWFAADWGVVTLQPFRHRDRTIRRRDTLDMSARIVVRDGQDLDEAALIEEIRR
jgi:hypothetical protein